MGSINNRKSEKGNVLFLILIAVALFAALSYAVTQSTRSGSGTADAEKALLSGATMTQYPTALRTSIIRMVLGGTDVSNIVFDAPAAFTTVSDLEAAVFHPTGGGAVFQQAPADVMAGATQGNWFYNANMEIPLIGIDGAGGNDVIAFLPGVSSAVCRNVNKEFSINTTGCTMTDGVVPDLATASDESLIRDNFVEGDTFPVGSAAATNDIVNAACNAFSGQPSGCFFDADISTDGEYVFYSVLLER